jgi:hypothetical protein
MKKLYNWQKAVCALAFVIAGSLSGLQTAHAQETPPEASNTLNSGNEVPGSRYSTNNQPTIMVYDSATGNNKLPNKVALNELVAEPANGSVMLRWRTNWEPENLQYYAVEYSNDGIHFRQAGALIAGNYLNSKAYEFKHNPMNVPDRAFYRVKIVDKNGRYDYSRILPVTPSNTTKNYVYPTIVESGVVSVYLNDAFKQVQIVTSDGKVLQNQWLNGRTGRVDLSLMQSTTGICFVRVIGNDPRKNIVQKIFVQ